MMPSISVIVPVYNQEKYLSFCIDSILQQTYTNFELLLIDDGSIDNSGNICDEYAAKDGRIRVFHTINQGSAMARNVGLDNARGEYISFIDSDDAISINYLELLLDTLNSYNADMVGDTLKGLINNDDADTKQAVTVQRDNVVSYTRDEALYTLVNNYRTYFIMPMKLYKASVFNNIRYPSVRKNDDEWVIHHILLNVNRFILINKGIYYYRLSANSQTRSFSLDDFSGVLALLDRAKELQLYGYDALVTRAYINFFKRMVTFCDECREHKISFRKEYNSIKKDLRYAYKSIRRNVGQDMYSGRDKMAMFLFVINYKLYKVFAKMFSAKID